MIEKIVLTGFGDPKLWRTNPVFREVMRLCNDAADKKKFVPVREQDNAQPVKGKKLGAKDEK